MRVLVGIFLVAFLGCSQRDGTQLDAIRFKCNACGDTYWQYFKKGDDAEAAKLRGFPERCPHCQETGRPALDPPTMPLAD